MVGSFVECLLGIIQYDQPKKSTCEPYVIGGPVLFHQLGNIATVPPRFASGTLNPLPWRRARWNCLSEAASPYRQVGFLNGFRGYLDIGEVEELVREGDGLAIGKSATIPRVSLVRAPRSLKGTPKL